MQNSSTKKNYYRKKGFISGIFRSIVFPVAHEPAAESFELSEDGMTYTCKLKADAKWSDGEALTADERDSKSDECSGRMLR